MEYFYIPADNVVPGTDGFPGFVQPVPQGWAQAFPQVQLVPTGPNLYEARQVFAGGQQVIISAGAEEPTDPRFASMGATGTYHQVPGTIQGPAGVSAAPQYHQMAPATQHGNMQATFQQMPIAVQPGSSMTQATYQQMPANMQGQAGVTYHQMPVSMQHAAPLQASGSHNLSQGSRPAFQAVQASTSHSPRAGTMPASQPVQLQTSTSQNSGPATTTAPASQRPASATIPPPSPPPIPVNLSQNSHSNMTASPAIVPALQRQVPTAAVPAPAPAAASPKSAAGTKPPSLPVPPPAPHNPKPVTAPSPLPIPSNTPPVPASSQPRVLPNPIIPTLLAQLQRQDAESARQSTAATSGAGEHPPADKLASTGDASIDAKLDAISKLVPRCSTESIPSFLKDVSDHITMLHAAVRVLRNTLQTIPGGINDIALAALRTVQESQLPPEQQLPTVAESREALGVAAKRPAPAATQRASELPQPHAKQQAAAGHRLSTVTSTSQQPGVGVGAGAIQGTTVMGPPPPRRVVRRDVVAGPATAGQATATAGSSFPDHRPGVLLQSLLHQQAQAQAQRSPEQVQVQHTLREPPSQLTLMQHTPPEVQVQLASHDSSGQLAVPSVHQLPAEVQALFAASQDSSVPGAMQLTSIVNLPREVQVQPMSHDGPEALAPQQLRVERASGNEADDQEVQLVPPMPRPPVHPRTELKTTLLRAAQEAAQQQAAQAGPRVYDPIQPGTSTSQLPPAQAHEWDADEDM